MDSKILFSQTSPFSFLCLASILCFCSRPALASVAASILLNFSPCVTSLHNLLDSNFSCSDTDLTFLGTQGIEVMSRKTSDLPEAHLAIILPFHSPSTYKISDIYSEKLKCKYLDLLLINFSFHWVGIFQLQFYSALFPTKLIWFWTRWLCCSQSEDRISWQLLPALPRASSGWIFRRLREMWGHSLHHETARSLYPHQCCEPDRKIF